MLIRSTTASMAELISSTMTTNTTVAIKIDRWLALLPNQSAAGSMISARVLSWRKASSCCHAARNPLREYFDASRIRAGPVRPGLFIMAGLSFSELTKKVNAFCQDIRGVQMLISANRMC